MRTPVILLLGASLLWGGCGGPRPESKQVPEEKIVSRSGGCIPYNLRVEVKSGTAVVRFQSDCSLLISGYNIYVSREPIVGEHSGPERPESVRPWNQDVFAGDTSPEDGMEEFVAEGLEDGVPYFVHVRTVFPDRTMSKPSTEAVIVPGPRGTIELTQRFKSERDGFSFGTNGYARADDLSNDLYYYANNGRDYLASPDRLGFLRTTYFRVLPFRGELGEVTAQLRTLSSLPAETQVVVNAGDWVQIMTQDKTFALMQVLGAEGAKDNRRLALFYAYSPAVGAPVF